MNLEIQKCRRRTNHTEEWFICLFPFKMICLWPSPISPANLFYLINIYDKQQNRFRQWTHNVKKQAIPTLLCFTFLHECSLRSSQVYFQPFFLSSVIAIKSIQSICISLKASLLSLSADTDSCLT